MKSTVSLRKCDDYEASHVGPAVQRVVDDIGGIESFFKRGDRVLLKPNLLMSSPPEMARVTHPAVVEAVAGMVIEAGAQPFIGDSPPMGNLARVLSKSGYDPFMKRMGIQAVPFSRKLAAEFNDERLFRRIELASEIFDFDAVINLPKLKTHGQMFLTLAVKNLFGAIIGPDKAAWHLKAGKDYDSFAIVLVQILERVQPAFSLMDGILGMEGNGPNNGTPREVGIVAASADAVALDATICRLLGLKAERLLTCALGQANGIGVAEENQINVVGDAPAGFPLRNFKTPKSMTITWNMTERSFLRRFLEGHFISTPRIDKKACVQCKICLKHCPPKAISEKNGRMEIDHRACISCFCCQELCTSDAIRFQQPWLGRLLALVAR